MSIFLRRAFLFRTMASLSSPPPISRAPISETPAQTRKEAIADSALIDELIALSKKNPKLVKATEAPVPGCEDVAVKSWKMNEFKYYDVPSPFPTLARGLFTQEVRENSGKGKEYRIVARGYDKFFNIGEVPWTTVRILLPFLHVCTYLPKSDANDSLPIQWASLEANTEPPYTLTLKSNGCIIFIAALTPTKLVVTSKHALGAVNGVAESHSQVGERWLKKHLVDAQKTEEDLAACLWERNWTAVAEVSLHFIYILDLLHVD